MNDITHKIFTLRMARAQAIVQVSDMETIKAILNSKVPKGDVFSMAKAAALLGVKKTSDLIPDCHPMPIESAKIEFEISELKIIIFLEVKTIYKTGVEVEAMHGASIAALTIYDMLKPIDKGVEICNIKLLEKRGGKSDFKNPADRPLTAAVIVCSDSVSTGQKEDVSGKIITSKLESLQVKVESYSVIPDEGEPISRELIRHSDAGIDLILFTGGTGLALRDITPNAVKPLLEIDIPGIMENARQYGNQRTPYSMLSRGISGMRKKSLVLTFPGSAKAVTQYMDVLFPYVFHIFKMQSNPEH